MPVGCTQPCVVAVLTCSYSKSQWTRPICAFGSEWSCVLFHCMDPLPPPTPPLPAPLGNQGQYCSNQMQGIGSDKLESNRWAIAAEKTFLLSKTNSSQAAREEIFLWRHAWQVWVPMKEIQLNHQCIVLLFHLERWTGAIICWSCQRSDRGRRR